MRASPLPTDRWPLATDPCREPVGECEDADGCALRQPACEVAGADVVVGDGAGQCRERDQRRQMYESQRLSADIAYEQGEHAEEHQPDRQEE